MGKKLLVADDSLTIQKVIKLALSHDGYDIQTVADGNELMAQVSLFRPDVILIDLGLPGRTTFEVKKELNEKSDLKDIPCVLMASAFEKVDEAKVGLLGFDGRLTKPFDPSHLREVLQKAIQSRGVPANFDPAKLPPPPKKQTNELPQFPSLDLPDDPISLNDPIWTDESHSSLAVDQTLPPPIPQDTGFITPDSIETTYQTDEKTDEVNIGVFTGLNMPDLSSPESDIRHLTESTVKMSGLDDLGDWNINDTSSAKLPPIPSIFEPSRLDIELPKPSGPTAAPPPPRAPSAPAAPSVTDALAEIPTSKEIEEMVEKQVRSQLEEMIQAQVSAQIEKFVKNGLPDLAERIVKAEIKKLLEGLG